MLSFIIFNQHNEDRIIIAYYRLDDLQIVWAELIQPIPIFSQPLIMKKDYPDLWFISVIFAVQKKPEADVTEEHCAININFDSQWLVFPLEYCFCV